MITLPATTLIRWRWWVIAAWAGLALLLAPAAARLHQLLAVRGTSDERTEAYRAGRLIGGVLPNPVAEYVAIVVRGPVRWTDPRFERVLDSVSAAAR